MENMGATSFNDKIFYCDIIQANSTLYKILVRTAIKVFIIIKFFVFVNDHVLVLIVWIKFIIWVLSMMGLMEDVI